jgi:hypothetical protein
MSYFNHAFRKTFLGTSTAVPNGISTLNNVVLGAPGVGNLPAGQLTFIDPDNWKVFPNPTSIDCCEFILASGSLMDSDKTGPFHGGYKESNKSKTIKGKYVSKIYASPAQAPNNYVVHVGTTPWTAIVPPVTGKPGETAGDCCKPFLCGETYYLRVDVKGSPALRLLNHNAYLTLEGYTGCCDDDVIAPTPVDPRVVYIAWAKQLAESPIMKGLVYPVVTYRPTPASAWSYYYPDDTVTLPVIPGAAFVGRYSDFVNNGYQAGECAGLVLNGAYVDTRFENCTFQVTDFYELEPLRVYASEVDYTGSPCEFNALCVGVECYGRQANGIGETVARDVILSERYRQNFFHSDLRIREITQGNDLLTAGGFLSRTAYYDRVYIQHNIPRFYNPTSTFDNDQYLLEVVFVNGSATPTGNLGAAAQNFLNLMTTWANSCGANCEVDSIDTTGANCASLVPIPAIV